MQNQVTLRWKQRFVGGICKIASIKDFVLHVLDRPALRCLACSLLTAGLPCGLLIIPAVIPRKAVVIEERWVFHPRPVFHNFLLLLLLFLLNPRPLLRLIVVGNPEPVDWVDLLLFVWKERRRIFFPAPTGDWTGWFSEGRNTGWTLDKRLSCCSCRSGHNCSCIGCCCCCCWWYCYCCCR